MAYHVKLSDLAKMPVVDSNRVLGELVRSAKSRRNGQSAVLDARISDYELRYEMSSGDMRRKLKDGTLRETADIARWLMTLAARDNRGTSK
jgi:hypothetical protein